MKLFFSQLLLLLFLSGCYTEKERCAYIPTEADFSRSINALVGVDHLGRVFHPIHSFRDDKQTGLFFWPWIGQPYATGIYDATKILAMPNGVSLLTDFNMYDEKISPNGQAHFWGEPIWKYYNSEDEWVIRKQMQMLTMAGIDFIYFDTTNALIYQNVIIKILRIISEYQHKGWNPPKIMFYTHSKSIQTTNWIYREIYQPGLYPETWYRIDGKPAIVAYTNVEDDLAEAKSRNDIDYAPTPLSDEILAFFHFFKPQWPSDSFIENGFPWVEWTYPQPIHSGVMSVTVASHPMVPMSFSLTRGWNNWGRGWNPEIKKNVLEDVEKGAFFQKQWDRAIEADPDIISIGGWNEWIAYKQPWDGEYMLCDAVNIEFSRDIEPMKGGYQDAYYIQMIQNIRRYKGSAFLGMKTEKKGRGTNDFRDREKTKSTGVTLAADGFAEQEQTIRLSGKLAQWDKVNYRIINIGSDDIGRDNYGISQTVHYKQDAPQHILQEVRITHDRQYVYFYIRCNRTMQVEHTHRQLQLLIGTGEPGSRVWECYDYRIGRAYDDSFATIDRIGKDFSHMEIGKASYTLQDSILLLRIPRDAIALDTHDVFYFKVASEVNEPSDLMSYYTSGSCMPMGRLSYLYRMKK